MKVSVVHEQRSAEFYDNIGLQGQEVYNCKPEQNLILIEEDSSCD